MYYCLNCFDISFTGYGIHFIYIFLNDWFLNREEVLSFRIVINFNYLFKKKLYLDNQQ